LGRESLKDLAKSPWMPKGMKRAKDAQKNEMGQGSPRWYEN